MFEPVTDYVRNLFAVKEPPTDEIGYYDSSLLNLFSFEAYNPDMLVRNKGNEIYKKMMRDDQVKSAMRFKQFSIVGRKFFFNKDPDKEEHEKMASFFMEVTKQVKGSWRNKLLGILSCLENGYSISEQVFKPVEWEEKTYWGLRDIKKRPFETIVFKTDPHGNIEEISQDVSGGMDKVVLDQNRVIHMAYQPDKDEIYGESDLRACYREYWSKDTTIKFRNIFLERVAGGLATVTMEKDTRLSEKDKDNIKRFLANMNARAGAFLPPGAKLDLHSPKDSKAYGEAIQACDKAISKALLVPNLLGLSEQGGQGSRAQSQTQFESFLFIIEALAEQLVEILNEQVFKQLAVWNFGTEDFPPFAFEAMSDGERMELAERWADLAHKGAVERSDTDENWIREMFGAPEKPEEEDTTAVDPTTALNGQQVSSLMDVVQRVSEGKMTKTTGVQVIFHSFPLTLEQAEELLADVEEGSMEPEPEPVATPPVPPAPGEDEDEESQGQLPEPNKPDVAGEFTASLEEGAHKEYVVREFAEKKWLRRVNFKKVQGMLEKGEDVMMQGITPTMLDIEASFERQIRTMYGNKAAKSINPKETKDLKVQSNHKSALQRTIQKSLNAMAFASLEEAQRELPKRTLASMETNIKNYAASRSFKAVRDMVGDMEDEVMNVMLNAIQFDYSVDQTMAALKENSKLAALWAPLNDKQKAARLETMSRTLMSDIFNKARKEFFAESQRRGYVQAYEYAAVLDQRTTAVCEALHGVVRRDFAERTPPNHMNCRSLLVAITVQDEWDGKQDRIPAAGIPQEGFGEVN